MATKKQKKGAAATVVNATLAHGARQVVQNHGEAVNIWVDGYTDPRGLREVGTYSAPDRDAATRHAGKAGEVLHKTKVNADRAKQGNPRRIARTDDIGRVNDPVIDIVEADGQGPGGQIKLGRTAENTWKEIVRKGPEKYAEAHEILVPSDQVQQVHEVFDQRIANADRMAGSARRRGDLNAAEKWEGRADAYRDAKGKVKPSEVTQKEAERAYTNPVATTAKGILTAAHDGGVTAAKTGAMLVAGISGAQNLVAVIKGDKEIGDAVVATAVATVKAAAVSYAVGAGGALIKAGMEQVARRVASQAASGVLKGLAGSNVPALIVISTVEVGKSLVRFLNGEIDDRQLMGELGEKAVGITGSAYGASVGATAGAWVGGLVGSVVPVLGTVAGAAAGGFIGGVVGSMAGYVVSTQLYQAAATLLKQGAFAAERRARLIAMCQQAEAAMRREREELERLIEQHYADRALQFGGYFEDLRDAILADDADGVTLQLQNVTEAFGGSLHYQDDEEFEAFMLDQTKSVKVCFS